VIIVYLLMALIGSATTIFAFQNSQTVPIQFLIWKREVPLVLIIMLSLLIGIVVASLSGVVRIWKLRSRVRQLESQMAQLTATQAVPPAPRSPQGPTLPA
jgi:putative membrane protein